MALKAYEEFAAEQLAFPINGKMYTPPPIGARVGIELIQSLVGELNHTAPSQSLWQMVLGPVYDEMIADNVPLDALARAGFAMIVDWQNDRAAAVRVWESGIDPEARAAMTAAARGVMTPPSTPAAAGSTTRRPASGTGTRATKTTTKKAASRSSSRGSSRAGR